jgi:hypothetical protein
MYVVICFVIPGYAVKQSALFRRKQGLRCGQIDRLLGNRPNWQTKKPAKSPLDGGCVNLEAEVGQERLRMLRGGGACP